MTRADFNDLIIKISSKLYVFAFRILKNQTVAEDIVQEVFIKLWNMKTKLEEYESIEALATTITRNLCIDQIRKQKWIENYDNGTYNSFKSVEPTPDELLEQSETMTIIDAIIEMLPETYREIIRQRDIDGLSFEEIAENTNQNINTLRVNLSRARKMVRDEYKKSLHE